MSENILTAALTFALLTGGTLAIGSEMLQPKQAAAAKATMTAKATTATTAAVATLPMVTVIGRREAPTRLAVETQTAQPQRVQ